MGRPKLDIKNGDRFDKLVVIGDCYNKHNQRCLVCLCDCGVVKNYLPHNLMTGNIKSCGCGKIERLKKNFTLYNSGSKLGDMTIIDTTNSLDKFGKRIVVVQCVCGKIKNVSVCSRLKSCGCSRRTKTPEISELNKIQRAAEKRGLEFSLSLDDFRSLIYSNCYYCGQPPSTKMHVGIMLRNGIDRIDNSRGYHISNVVSCCKRCNVAKNDLTSNDFFELVRRIYQRHFR